MIAFIFSRTVASSLALSADRKICSKRGLKCFWVWFWGGDLKVALLALRGEFLLKASDCTGVVLGFAFGDLFGLSKVSAPIIGLALVLAWFGAVRPPHVFLDVGGNLGVSFGEV